MKQLGSIFIILAALLAFATLPGDRVTVDTMAIKEGAGFGTLLLARAGFALSRQEITHMGVVKFAKVTLSDGEVIHFIGLPFTGRYYVL